MSTEDLALRLGFSAEWLAQLPKHEPDCLIGKPHLTCTCGAYRRQVAPKGDDAAVGRMIGPDGYGDAEIRQLDDGTLEIVRADDVIGISVELLAEALGSGLWVDGDGLLWLAGDPTYKYRPVRFATFARGLTADSAVEGTRVIVCERVR